MENRILNIVEQLLGTGKAQGKSGDYLFFCPSCNHYKRKLSINIDKLSPNFGKWACWICQSTHRTKGRSLVSLLRHFNASEQQIVEMRSIVGDVTYIYTKKETVQKNVQLPKEFVSLRNDTSNSIGKRYALAELKRRRLNDYDIQRYNIGYCEHGEFANRIIVPSYDMTGVLNYFVARSYYDGAYLKYKNPEISKNVIAFDMFINWKSDVILVEGVFDAMAVRRNAIPLLGKRMSNALLEKIINIRPPAVYVALDQDAIQDSIAIANRLTDEQICNYIIMLDVKDPSDLGFTGMLDAYNNKSILINESNLFNLKLKYNMM